MPHPPTGQRPGDHGPDLDGSPAATPSIRAAFAALLPRSAEIADSISVQVLDAEHAWYGEASPEIRAELRASTRRHIRTAIERLAGHPDAGPRAVDVWRDTGRRRAQQGIPVAAVISAYTLGSRRLWEELLEAGQGMGVPAEVLLEAGQTLWGQLDVQCQILRESYRREELALQSRNPAQAAAVLDGLLRGRGSDPRFASEARGILDVTVSTELVCLVWLTEQSVPSVAVAHEGLQDAGFRGPWRLHGDYGVGLVAATPDQRPALHRALSRSLKGRVGTATCRDGLAGVVAAHHHALAAATSLPEGTDAVADISERLPEALIAGSPELTALLVDETIRPLLHLEGVTREALLETLVAAVRHGGSPTAAAEDLVCHRNTVVYRLKRIEKLTGRSLEDPRDRLLLSLATIVIRQDMGSRDG